MKTQHKRTESAHFPCKSPEPISLLPLDSIIRSWFQLPDFLFQNINFPLSELFQNSFKRKCRLGQSFYQDSSFELCEALERLFAQVSKPLVFSTALVTILRTFDKKSLLYKEIAQLIKQEDFEGKLRAFLLKIRVIEEENLFIAWVSSFILTKKVKTMLDCLIYLKMEYFTHKKSENKLKNSQVEYRMKIIKELLHKGLKLKFREELYEILYQNPFNKVFIDNISKSNEKEIIFIIKDLKFDSHSIFSTFELLLTQAKCYEINEFSLKLLEIFKEIPSAPQMMLSFLIKYDFNDCESFLEGLLEIMRVFLPTTKQDFQEKVHNLIAELQSSESLVLFNQTVDNNNIRESLDSNLEISSKLSKNTKVEYDCILTKTQRKYNDDLFIAGISSLLNNIKRPKYPKWRDIAWLRIEDAFKEYLELPLYNKSEFQITPKKLLMHKYLYTVFQAIKDKPRVLRTLLEKQIVNKKGVYYVKICQDGVWRYIIIDELLPFMKDNTGVSPAFISISNGIIWPLLIEKALAKIYHTYQSLELGNSIETLRDLTGAPSSRIPLDSSKKAIIPLLQKFLDLDFIVLLKIAKKYERNYEFLGFDSDFECQLIKIYELNQVMFFEIRTPTQVNNSDLLSSSQNTIKSVRSSDININISNILLDIDDFLDVFSLVQVSKIHKDYFYITTQITHIPNAYSIRSFELTHPGHCYIELSQLDKRYFRNLGSYNYIFSRLILAKRLNYYDDEFLGRSSFVYIDGVAERERNSHLDLYLDKGVYYIIVCLDYENRIYDACLSFYGEEKVELDRENFKNNEGVFEEIMKEIVSKYGRKIEIRPGLYISHYISVKDCLLIEFFSNETKDNSYEIKRRTSSKGLRRIGEKKTMEYYEFKLIGVEERTFLFKYQDGKEIGEVYRELNEDCEKDLEVNLIKDIRLE